MPMKLAPRFLRSALLLAVGAALGCSAHVEPTQSAGQAKSEVCHKGKKTLVVADAAVDAHLSHGDHLGHCR